MKTKSGEKRGYLRLNSVFPVKYQLIKAQTGESAWHQGFTGNVSDGGICLEFSDVDKEILALLDSPQEVRLNLRINIPAFGHPVSASAKVSWFKKEQDRFGHYAVGLRYDHITEKDRKKIMRFAYSKVLLPRLALGIIVILFLSAGIILYNNFRLSSDNKKLVKDMVNVLKDSSESKSELENIRKDKAGLDSRLRESESKIKAFDEQLKEKEEELKMIEEDNTEMLSEKEFEIQKLKLRIIEQGKDRAGLLEKMGDLGRKEETVSIKLNEIKEKKTILEKASFERMYQWVKLHQNPRTGLIISFEGDGGLSDQAFTYDQALSVIAFSYFKDYEPVKKILDFYVSRPEQKSGFYNGYYVSTGEASEFTVHSGPNLWLGIAVLQYTKFSQDNSYLPLAKNIARWIMKMQDEDSGKGLRGGPNTLWYSTEHNLDGFAFFSMLYKITQEDSYRDAGLSILFWLKANAYDSLDIPIKRGKGDATIATDTYAWSIASLGPQRLIDLGMDPEAIMRFAKDNCGVEVEFQRPDNGSVLVKGFDFARARHIARGGVISAEWTAQMALSYKLLSRYFAAKDDIEKELIYKNKAEEYLEELSKMIISSPSRTGQGQGCLPYASSDFVDTGHGWTTPKGENTGSLSATIYAILAYYGFNPLELSK